MLRAKLLALSWPVLVAWGQPDEPACQRFHRVDALSGGIAEVAGSNRLLAAFLWVAARNESQNFRRDVAECACPPGECDNGQAHGYWQIHRAPTESIDQWWAYCGTSIESATAGARRVKLFFDSRNLECSFARMGGNRAKCDDQWAKDRAEETRRIMGYL